VQLYALGPGKAVDFLVDAQPEYYAALAWADPHDQDQLRDQLRDALTQEQKQPARKLLNEQFKNEMRDLTRWWVMRMINTRAPFIEKMTLFWHGHFATSGQKVRPAFKCGSRTKPCLSLEPGAMTGNSIGNLSGPSKSELSVLEYLQCTALDAQVSTDKIKRILRS
jgi:Protein of unknown function (DUF1800)